MGNKPAKVRLPVIDGLDAWAHYDNGKWSIEYPNAKGLMIPTEHMEQILDNWGVKRNKKVDVPTEQWQKDIERRLQHLEFACKHKWLHYDSITVSDKS